MRDARLINPKLFSKIGLTEARCRPVVSDTVRQCFLLSHESIVDKMSPIVKVNEENMSPHKTLKLRKKMEKRGPYPEDGKREMSKQWKLDVLAWKKLKGYSYATIGKMCDGVTAKAVRLALTTDQATSSIVDKLTEVSGVARPQLSPMDEFDEIASRIPKEDRAKAAAILRVTFGDRLRQG